MQLFRQQAIDHQNRLYGEVLLARPLRWSAISFLMLGLAATFCLFLIFGSYSTSIATRGIVRPDGMIAIRPLNATDGRIAPGQAVLITLPDKTQNTTRLLPGVISQAGSSPIVRLVPPSGTLRADIVRLEAGTVIEARVLLARRSFLDWLAGPPAPAQ